MKYLSKSLCDRCGRGVFRYLDELFDPITGTVLTQPYGNQRPEMRRAYVAHICSDSDIENYRAAAHDIVNQLLDLREEHTHPWDQADYVDAQTVVSGTREEMKALVAKHALTQTCSKCDAEIGRPCENLTQRRAGRTVPTKTPHEERIPDLDSPAGQSISALRDRLGLESGVLNQIYAALAADEALERLITVAKSLR